MNKPVLVLGVCALMLSLGGKAFAGVCPADKVGENKLANAPAAPVGVTDNELASIDLSKENVKLSKRRLRMRQMIIAPGGVVPLHSHADRPALIMVVSGEILKTAANVLYRFCTRQATLRANHWAHSTGGKMKARNL